MHYNVFNESFIGTASLEHGRGGGIREESETKIHSPRCTDISVCAMHNNKTERDFIVPLFLNIFPEKL
jgi:hypothetical protein